MGVLAQPFAVRVVYIVPADATPWNDARRRASEWLEDMQWFFADEMKRHGFGGKTFEIARDAVGDLEFSMIRSALSTTQFTSSSVNNCKRDAEAQGLRSGSDVVVYFLEAYTIVDGKVSGATAEGGGRGQGGEAFISSLLLKVARREWLPDNRGYDGSVFDWISPQPMKVGTLSWNGRGLSLGDVSGAAFGAMGHELGHAFGLAHGKTNGTNRKGEIMGNGCRGMRGYFCPTLTADFCDLCADNAALLNKSEFFAVRKLKPRSWTM